MLLELCDTTLKEWLSESSLTVTMLDDILLFALNIATGVEFLHSKSVGFHLRLILAIRSDNINYINYCFVVLKCSHSAPS